MGIGSQGSQTHLLVNYLLSRHGIGTDDFNTVSIGLGASNLSALEHGRVDAGITTPNVLTLLQKSHPGTMVLFDPRPEDNFKKIFGVNRYPSHVLYAQLDWIQHNKSTVRSVAKAVFRALQYVEANSPEIIAMKIPAGYRSPDPAIDVAALKDWKPLYSRDGITPDASFEAVKAVAGLSLNKVRSATIDPAKIFTNEFLPTY